MVFLSPSCHFSQIYPWFQSPSFTPPVPDQQSSFPSPDIYLIPFVFSSGADVFGEQMRTGGYPGFYILYHVGWPVVTTKIMCIYYPAPILCRLLGQYKRWPPQLRAVSGECLTTGLQDYIVTVPYLPMDMCLEHKKITLWFFALPGPLLKGKIWESSTLSIFFPITLSLKGANAANDYWDWSGVEREQCSCYPWNGLQWIPLGQ